MHRLFLTGLACLCLGLTARAEGPALWTFSDDDTTVHLFGSIHLMKPGVDWYVDEVKEAFEASETLVVEANVLEADPQVLQQKTIELGQFQGDDKLSNYVSEETMAKLVEAFGGTRAQIEQFRPWFASIQLVNVLAARAGFRPDLGIDAVLLEKAVAQDMSIRALESLDYQLNLLASIGDTEQAEALELSLEQYDDVNALFDEMSTDWLEEDTQGLDAVLLQPARDETPELFEAIFTNRNQTWVDPITALLEVPGTHFVVVGAGHLVGEDSVVDLLEQRGVDLTMD